MPGGEARRIREELIPDHALAAGEEDLFGHRDLVERLVMVVNEASTKHSSANIALYGAWGSGKSSVVNLFEQRLEENEEDRRRAGFGPRYRFQRFDAFKYARKPFLRQFIRELAATQLQDEERKKHFQQQLYEERSRVIPKPNIHWRRALGILGLLTLLAAELLLLLEGEAHQIAVDVVRAGLLALVPSTVLVAMANLAVPFFTVSSKTSAPDSEEQFEHIFCGLLQELGIDGDTDERLVVFVDELDRCSPTEVATTLETLRTFLGVPGCIFIVAADQQVLEQALTHHVRQATPPDLANPYYSAGSAYLDKIFQYQLPLPPFRPRRLVDFALDLVSDREGVWREVDLVEVIPVLLPTHIHSPRRVKVLLNAFALTYGVARQRAKRGELETDILDRATEIAKLVCLRVEFPLFARDVVLDDRLTRAVVDVASAIERGDDPAEIKAVANLPVEIRRRAIAFARGDLRPAHLLAEDPNDSGLSAPLVDYRDAAAEEKEARAEEERSDQQPPRTAAPVRHVHGLQLVRYLEKTIEVPGPGSDLIHLEAAGVTFGLDPQLAHRLENEALDGREHAVAQTLASMGPERYSGLLLLGQVAHESHGVDGRNAMQSLLRAATAEEVPLREVAPALAADLDSFSRRNRFEPEDLPAALTIAVYAKRKQLTETVLRRKEALGEATYRATVLKLAAELVGDFGPRLNEVLAFALCKDGRGTVASIMEAPESTRERLFSGALDQLETWMSEDAREWRDAEGTEVDLLSGQLLVKASQLGEAINALAERQKPLAETLAAKLLILPTELVSDSVLEILNDLAPIESPATAEAVFAYSREFELSKTGALLATIGRRALPPTTETDPLLKHIWDETSEGTENLPTELVEALEGLFDRSMKERRKSSGERQAAAMEVATSLQVRIDSEASAEAFDQAYHVALKLSELGLIDLPRISSAVAETIAATVRPPLGPEIPQPVLSRLPKWVRWSLSGRAGITQLHHALQALREEDCWVPSPLREELWLDLAARATERGGSATPPSPARIKELIAEHGIGAGRAVAIWIEVFAPSPEAVAEMVGPYVNKPSSDVLRALDRYSQHRNRAMRTRLAKPLIELAFGHVPRPQALKAMRANAAEEDVLVEAICALAERATNPRDRRIVFFQLEGVEPVQPGPWSQLIKRLFLRFARSGAKAFDLTRTRLGLCEKMPEELVETLVEGMRAAVPPGDKARKRQLEGSLRAAGLVESSRAGKVSFPFRKR